MARQVEDTINGLQVTMQSVSPKWYFDQNSRYGMSSDKKDFFGYMDIMFKNVIIAPVELARKGMQYFEAQEDIETPELLIQAIERFLRPGAKPTGSTGAGAN